jgi:hypothetical protein
MVGLVARRKGLGMRFGGHWAVVGALCCAGPVMAQDNQPITMIPENSLAKRDWVEECVRRIDTMGRVDEAATVKACQTWWTYFDNGGAPVPGYGFAIPVRLERAGGARKAIVCLPHELDCRPRR